MRSLPKCLKPWTGFEIDDGIEHWGGIRPCCWGLKYAGNIAGGELARVWNNQVFREYRARMLANDTEGLCSPGCPIRNSSDGDRGAYLGMLWHRPVINHFHNLLEILLNRTRLKSTPLIFKVTPTLACNLRCIMCYQSHEMQVFYKPLEISELLHFAAKAQLLQVQGGEIFAAKAGLEFLEIIAERKDAPPIGIITNGTFPTQSAWDLLARLKINWLMVSVDAATSETYALIHRGGNWLTLMQNVRKLADLQKLLGFRLLLSFTVMAVNYKEMSFFIDLAHKINCDVCFNPLTPSQDTTDAGLEIGGDARLLPVFDEALRSAMDAADQVKMPMARSTLGALCNIYFQ